MTADEEYEPDDDDESSRGCYYRTQIEIVHDVIDRRPVLVCWQVEEPESCEAHNMTIQPTDRDDVPLSLEDECLDEALWQVTMPLVGHTIARVNLCKRHLSLLILESDGALVA